MADIGKLSISSPKAGEAPDGNPALLGTSTAEGSPGRPPQEAPEEAPTEPAGENENGIDKALLDALGCSKRRHLVVDFETEVDEFVRDGTRSTHFFSMSLTGYQRLLAHRVAQHYGLVTTSILDGENVGRITASKTGNEEIPTVKLSSVPLLEPSEVEGSSSAGVRTVLSRGPRRSGSLVGQGHSITFPTSGAQSAISVRPLQERQKTYSEARGRLLEGSIGRGAGRGYFGRGRWAGDVSANLNRSRGSAGRGRGPFRGQEDDVRDPDYDRYQRQQGGGPYGGPQAPPYGPAGPYAPEGAMRPGGMMMYPDPGINWQSSLYMGQPYGAQPDPAMQQAQGVPPMPGGPGMPVPVQMYGGPQGPAYAAYPHPYWNMPMQPGPDGAMMGMMQQGYPMYGHYPQYNMPYPMAPVIPQGRPQGRGAGSGGVPRRSIINTGQPNRAPHNPMPRPTAHAHSGPPGAHMYVRPHGTPGAGVTSAQRTGSGSLNTSASSGTRVHGTTYSPVGAGSGHMRPPPITLPRPPAFAPGASAAMRSATD